MSTFKMLKFEMSNSEGKVTQQKSEVNVLKLQVFKVSNLRWESNMGNVNIQNFNIWNVKLKGTRSNSKKLRWRFQSFKVSSLRWQSNMRNTNIQNVRIWSIKCHRASIYSKNSRLKFVLRSKLCYNMLIYVINITSNLWQVTARWDRWILL